MRLIDCARQARSHAYAPYSGFSCGAAVAAGGKVYSASNVENASYGLSCCAERIAIFRAVTEGQRNIDAVAVVGGGDTPPLPCGACLQVIAEFATDDIPIALACEEGTTVTYRLEQLLPCPFQLEQGGTS